jgi:hypothetical protein
MAGAGSYRADKGRMRYFVVVALIVLGVIFLRQKQAENSAPQKKAAEAVAQAALTPRPASEHDWAKAAIDRTNEVKRQVKRERASNEVP